MYESLLLEYSSTIALMKNPQGEWAPGAKAMGRWVTDQQNIGHDVKWDSAGLYDAILLRKVTPTGAILLQGSDGLAWITKSGNGVKLTLATDQSNEVSADKGKWSGDESTMAFVRRKIGDIQQAWITQNLRKKDVTSLRKKRASAAVAAKPQQILMRLKPLWLKMLTQALADLQGYTQQLIKHNSFEHAKNKLDHTERLHTLVDMLKRGESNAVLHELQQPLLAAVNLAAAHHYPHLSNTWLNPLYVALYDIGSNKQAVNQLLTDLSAGQYQLLGSVMGYFKQQLLKRI